jgi:N-acetylglutamate synthase-like GNAT family acetyltransferase
MNIPFSTPYLLEQSQTANSFTQRGHFSRVQNDTIAIDTVQFSSQATKPTKLTPMVLTLDNPDDMTTAAARNESLQGLLVTHFPENMTEHLQRFIDEYKRDPAKLATDYQQHKDELLEWLTIYGEGTEKEELTEGSIPVEALATYKVLNDYIERETLLPQHPSSLDSLIVIPNPHQENSYLGMTLLQRYGRPDSKIGKIMNACVDEPWRGQGLFSQMITMAENEARKQSLKYLFLGTYKDSGLVEWYKKQGYEIITSQTKLPKDLADDWQQNKHTIADNHVYLLKTL